MPKLHSWFFYLCALEGAAAIAALFLIPSEGGRLSLARLALIGFLARDLYRLDLFGKFGRPTSRQWTSNYATRLPVYLYYLCTSLWHLARFSFSCVISTRRVPSPPISASARYCGIYCSSPFNFLSSFYFLTEAFIRQISPPRKPIYLSALAAFCLLLLFFLFISLTRLGLTPDPAYWGEPGVPMLGWQFGLALVAGLCILALTFSPRARALNFFLPLTLYLFALILWLSVPVDVLANSFYMPINPPAFQPFPYSDAGYYDQMAHSLLIGHPYQGTIPTRPFTSFC